MNKWTKWYDGLPEHTKESIKNEPVWHDLDLFKMGVVGFFIGLLLGLAI